VVLLHGIARTHADWTEQHELLSDRFRVYSVDLAGFGGSDPLPGRYSLAALASFVSDFLDAVGVDAPAHLVGNSLGGAVAMQLSVQAPTRVRTLALVNSAGFGKEVTIALRVLAVRGLAALLLRPSLAGARRMERALYFDRSFVTDERIQYGYRIATRPHGARVLLELARNLGTVRGVRQAWRDELTAAVASREVPTIVVWGDRDLILPAAHLEAARTLLPHARFHLFRDTGHMPQVERAEEFSKLLVDFWG
jgi:pimeloyl-ACP methyl ester carboxylesterase